MKAEQVPETYIADIELAQTMALAEKPFREYAILAEDMQQRLTDVYADLPPITWMDFNSSWTPHKKARAAIEEARRIANYYVQRGIHASDVVQAEHDGHDTPIFSYHWHTYEDVEMLERADARRNIKLVNLLLRHPDVAEKRGLTEDSLHRDRQHLHSILRPEKIDKADKAVVKPEQPVIDRRLIGHTSLRRSKNKMLDNMFSRNHLTPEAITSEQVQDFASYEPLQRLNLLSGFIRKNNVAPIVFEFLAKHAWNHLLETVGGDLSGKMKSSPTSHWQPTRIADLTESLVDRFNGTVTDVSVMKLPITEEWKKEYFESKKLSSIQPASIERLKFIATLKPTGKPEAYSTLDTVLYTMYDNNDRITPKIMVTTRKADRVTAEVLQESLRQESIAIAHVLELTQSHEVLVGLPSLGKRR